MHKKIDIDIKKILINEDSTIEEAMLVIEGAGTGIGVIVDKDKKLSGVITDGDIRRAILKGVNITEPVLSITSRDPIFLEDDYTEKTIDSLNLKNKAIFGFLKIPIIDKDRFVKGLILISVNSSSKNNNKENSELPINKILITGGAGYLGSILCRKLLEKGYKINILDNLTYGEEGIKDLFINDNFKLIKGDIRNIADIMEAVKEVDAVIHLAAIVGDSLCKLDSKTAIGTNYLATKILIDACKYFGINRFIFASTCSVYGQNNSSGEKLTEVSPLEPISLYAQTKIDCEKQILEANDENFSPTILRMATLYGISPLMRFDLALNLLSARAVQDKEITIFGGEQWRPWLHLEDLAKAYIFVLEAPITKIKGEIFNVLSENYKIIEVAEKIRAICSQARLKIEDKATDKRNYNVSFEKISGVLGFKPEKKLADGIIEIKNAIEKGVILNYKDAKYRFSFS